MEGNLTLNEIAALVRLIGHACSPAEEMWAQTIINRLVALAPKPEPAQTKELESSEIPGAAYGATVR